MMLDIFLAVLSLAGTVCTLLGMLVLTWTFIKPMSPPADTSNRIAHIRLVWFALTRPEMFVDVAPWLKKDELDIISQSCRDNKE